MIYLSEIINNMKIRLIPLLFLPFIVISIFVKCNYEPKSIAGVTGEIIWTRVSNLARGYGHPPTYRSEVRVINNTSNFYILGCSDEDHYILSNKVGETIHEYPFLNPRILEPGAIDTLLITVPIHKELGKEEVIQFLNANLRYVGSSNCKFDSILNFYFQDYPIEGEPRILDSLEFNFNKKSQKIIENEVVN